MAINIDKTPKDVLGQLIKGNYNLTRIKEEEGEKILRKIMKEKAMEIAQQPGGLEIIASQVPNLDEQEQQSQQSQSGTQSRQSSSEPKVASKPASSPFGFGGVKEENGQMVEQQPGILAGLLSMMVTGNPKASADMDLNRMMKMKQIQSGQSLSPAEMEKISLQGQKEMMVAQYKSALESAMKGTLKPNEVLNKYEPIANDFQAIVDSFARVEASVEGGSSAAGDLALIFNYMKMLDPNSVVRESEFANAAASGALGERFIAVGKKLAAGERLSPAMRNDFTSRAKKLFQAKERQYEQAYNGFKTLAINSGIEPKNVLRKISYVKNLEDMSEDELKKIAAGGE